MADIKIKVEGERAINLTPEKKLVTKNERYSVEFEFDEKWSESALKMALFIVNEDVIPMPFRGNTVEIPMMVGIEILKIGVKANDIRGLQTTTSALVKYDLAADDGIDNEVEAPKKNIYDIVVELQGQKGQPNGIATLDENGKVPKEQLPNDIGGGGGSLPEGFNPDDYVKFTDFDKEFKKSATDNSEEWTDEDKAKACKTIGAATKTEVELLRKALMQSGTMYKADTEETYNERITANGLNVLDGSKAVLKKVVGSTISYGADENGMNGTLKSASFGGIESTNADGTETSTLIFPKTEMPLGMTIDFENKKITDYGKEIVLNGTENFSFYYSTVAISSVMIGGLGLTDANPVGVATDDTIVPAQAANGFRIAFGNIYWYGILAKLGYTDSWIDKNNPTKDEQAQAIAKLRTYLAQRYANGNPVTIRYVSATLQSESNFTADNEYTAYKGGTENVFGNDNFIYGANNTLTQNYIMVKE